MKKTVFLDRDGTINIEKNYLYRVEDFELLPGVIDALKMLQNAGYQLIIITNQSGIARGYYTEKQYHELNNWIIEMFKNNGIDIVDSYYCPHHPDAVLKEYKLDCSCRKPKIGLFEQAIKEHDVNLIQSFVVGDKIRDCAICEKMECKGYLIGNNEDEKVIQSVKMGLRRNIEYVESLEVAAKIIVENSNSFV